ncbi:hypothetical protein HYY75_11155 [bacterium]|nr:hypothetical protein [bacterium]
MVEITKLLIMQDFDLEIDKIDEKLNLISGKTNRMDLEIKQEEELLAKKIALLKKVTLRMKQNEDEVKDLGEKLKILDLKQRSSGLSPNAYLALQTEMEKIREVVSPLETRVLEDMEKIEILQKDIEKGKKVTAGRRVHFEEVKGKRKKEVEEIQKERELVSTKRNQASLEIEPDVLGLYEELRRKGKGRALWEAQTEGCPACGLSLPRSFLKKIVGKTTADPCPNCEMLLCWTGVIDEIL